jgi:DNA uptake protein ComE-like DNA-binding protein
MACNARQRRGSILLLVLMAIVIMTLATSSYLVLMRIEHQATRNAGQQLQARMLAESGADYLCLFLDQTDALITQQGGTTANPGSMQAVLVLDDLQPESRGRFTVIAPDVVRGYFSGMRYGLEDESGKLNINSVALAGGDETGTRERLMYIPGMTEDVADAILDWIDEDNQPRAYGAEDTYYMGLSPTYQPKNGPIQSLSELLQVRGVTYELLYGLDANRNHAVDEHEIARGQLLQIDNTLGQMNRGWAAYLTVYSAERSLTPTGVPKVNVNNSDLTELQSELQQVVDAETANFIIAYRQFGASQNTGGPPTGTPSSAASLTLNLQTQPTTEIESLLDLVGATVTIQQNQNGQPGGQPGGQNPQDGQNGGENGGQEEGGNSAPPGPQQPGGGGQTVSSPWQDSTGLYAGTFLDVLDKLTTSDEPARGGRININTATRPILLSVPNMTEVMADQIITMREAEVDRTISPQRHSVWLLASSVVTLDQMKLMDRFITAGGDVYSAQIVGFFDGLPVRCRSQVLFDRTDATTLIMGWEDLSQLGPGYSAKDLGAPELAP